MTHSGSRRSVAPAGLRAKLMRQTAIGGALLVMAHAGSAVAMPKLASIPTQVARAPVITAPNANLTTVALQQSRTLINWASFDIAKGQQVDFLFQNPAGVVLNRVNSLAMIDGKLLGCVATCAPGGRIGGNVWIYSPTGVVFGPNAQVNVGGLLATTSPLLSDKAFLDGSQLSFQFGGGLSGSGIVVESGARLQAQGALALISPSVTTEAGARVQAGGTVLYGAAQNYVIHFDESAGAGLSLLDFEVPASALTDGTISATPLTLAGQTTAGKVLVASVSRPSVMNAVISLGGTIVAGSASAAGGGDIILSASGGPATVDISGVLQATHAVSVQAPDGGAINISGSIASASAAGQGGAITVGGAGTGAVTVASSGRLDASSSAPGTSGGSVILTGDALVVDGAITARGPSAGGTILVGGGDQGLDAAVANAATTDIAAGAVLDASATSIRGSGGHVVVWSDQGTQFQGAIISRGLGGGSAEVSSGGSLAYAGSTDLRGANGSAGHLLLDPSELIVIPSGGSGTVSGGATSATSTIGADVIDAALLSADVTISTHMGASGGNGVIEFNGGAGPLVFANTGTTNRTLTFAPEQGFLFDTGVATKGTLNLTLNAGASPVSLPAAGIAVTDGALSVVGSNLSLLGNLTAPQITLTASGSINQTAGVVTGTLQGSSGGATSLTGANAIGTLQGFTAGSGLTVNNAIDLSVTGVSAGSGALSLTTTSGALTINGAGAGGGINLTAASNLNVVGDVTGGATVFTAGGAIDQASGVITASTLAATAANGISLTDANAVSTLGALGSTGSGGVAFQGVGAVTLTDNINAPGQSVSLVAAGGALLQTSGAITANFLTASANGAIGLAGANTVSVVGGLVANAANVSFVDSSGFTLTGDVAAAGQTASLTSTGGAITQTGGVITASSFSATAAAGLSLSAANQVPTVTALSGGSGGVIFTDNQTLALGGLSASAGDISINVTAGDLNLNSAVTAPGSLTLSAAGAVNTAALTVAGDYSVTGAAINTMALQPTLTGAASNLTIDFTSTLGSTDLSSIPLSAPGSVTLTANDSALNIGSISAGANVTLSSAGSLSQDDGGVTAASLTASAVNGLNLSGPNAVSTVTSLINTNSGSVYFRNTGAVTVGSVNQGGGGGITLTTDAGDLTLTAGIVSASSVYLNAGGDLTMDGVTAAGDITLNAGGALTEAVGAPLSTGGNYTASAMTMNAAAMQPVFTDITQFYEGNLSLSFTQTSGLTDLTGIALSAPQSVSVGADANLKIGSITAGANVTLDTSGVLSAASGATISLTATNYYENFNVTAASIDVSNPAILQPIFAPTPYGNIMVQLTQAGIAQNLTGAPLSAPGTVSVTANAMTLTGGGTDLTLDTITAGGSVTASASGALEVSSISSQSNITLSARTALSAAPSATINLLGSYTATAQTIDPTNPVVLQPTFLSGSTGSLNLTFTQSGATTDISAVPLSAPGSISVAISPNALNENLTVRSITAGGGVTLSTASYSSNSNGALTIGAINAGGSVSLATGFACGGGYYCGGYAGGPMTSGSITAGGDVTASTGDSSSSAFTFQDVVAGGAVSLATGYYNGGNLTVGAVTATGGSVNLFTGYDASGALTAGVVNAGSSVSMTAGASSSGVLTANSIVAGGDVTLDAGGALQTTPTQGPPVSVTTGGNYSATGATIDPLLFQPIFTGSFGNLTLNFTGSGSTADLTGHPLTAMGGSVSVSANNENLTVDSIAAGGDITLSTGDALAAAAGSPPVTMTTGGSYSATGATIDPTLFQPTFTGTFGDLALNFTASGSTADLGGYPLTAPGGSVSVSAVRESLIVDSITAGGDITLYASGALAAAPVSPSAIMTTGGNYTASGNTILPMLFQPVFTGTSGNLSLTFFSGQGANLTGSALNAPVGSVSVTTTSGNLTVDSITASGDVSLTSAANLAAVSASTISLFGDYSAKAQTISATNLTVLQPTFQQGSSGSLSLEFTQSGSTTDLTGIALSAPGSVSVRADYENLTVDSITAGADVSLYANGALQASSSGSPVTISLGGNYTAEGVTIDPTLYQPTYTANTGDLNLIFDQSNGSINLTGHPLNAPGSISIALNGSTENLTVDTLTAGGNINIGASDYYNTGTLTAGAINAGGGVTLSTGGYYAGAITTGAISAVEGVSISTGGYYGSGVLTVGPINAGGDVSLSSGNYSSYGAALTAGSISAGGQVNVTSGGYSSAGVSVGPITAGSSVSLSAGQYSTGVLTVDSITANGGVTLAAGGALQPVSPGVVITLGGSYSATGLTIDPVLYQPIFETESTGGLSLNFHQTGSAIDLTGHPLTAPGAISVSASEDLTVDSLTAAGQVSLSSSGALNEVSSAVITATGLSASATHGIVLNGANDVQLIYGLSNNGTGGISFTNVGDIVLDGYYSPVSAIGQTVNLVSLTGSISDNSYYYYYYYPSITAGTLTASAATGIDLVRYNQVSNLGSISNSTSGGINFNDAYSYTLVGDVSAPGQTINLTSVYGGINQTAGVITAASFTASAETGLAFNDANAVASLGALSNISSGGISFTNGGDLVLGGDLTATGQQTVNLVSNTGSINEGSSVIVADTFTGSAATGVTLTGTNELVHLGAISNTSSGGISVTNDGDLTLVGEVTAENQAVNLVSMNGALTEGLGSVTGFTLNLSAVTGIGLGSRNFVDQLGTITTTSGGVYIVTGSAHTGSSADLVGPLTAMGQSVSLLATNGGITETTGLITADSVTATAATGLSLTGSNKIGALGLLANGATGGIAYTSAGGVALNADLNGFGEAVSLTAQAGSVTQSAGEILTAGTLNLGAATGVTLGGANAVTHLGVVNTAAGGVSLNDTVNLSLTGDLQASGQTVGLTGATSVSQLGGAITANLVNVSAVDGISFTDVSGDFGSLTNSATGGVVLGSNSGNLLLTADVSAPGQTVNLYSDTGTVSQSGGIVTASVLNVSGATGVSLNDANQVTALGTVFNTVSGGVAVTNVGGIGVRLIDAPGQTVSLTSTTGAVTQSTGLIVASTLNASAATGISLMGGNLIANLGVLSNSTSGGISYLSVGDPNLTGNISAAGQAVTLVSSTSGFNQTAGIITADTLTVSAVTGISLTDANVVTKLGALTNTGSGGIGFTNTGDLSLTDNLTAAGQTVSIGSSGGAISQAGGVITADTLSASAATGVTLNGVNLVSNIGVLSNSGSGGISLTVAPDPNLTGNITASGQTVTLVSAAGGFTQTAGVITAGTLNVTAATGIALNDANKVSNLGTVSNTGSGGIGFTNAIDFNITGDVTAPNQALTLVSTGGGIHQTGGAIGADTVGLNATGLVSLTDAIAATQATIVAGDLNLTPVSGASVALQAPTVTIESHSGLIDLGDNLVDPGFTGMAISNADFGAIKADKIALYAGYYATDPTVDLAGQATNAIKVGDLSWNASGLSEPAGGATLSLFAGSGSTVSVLGDVSPTAAGSGNLVIGDSVADTWTPKAINISGSIGTVAGSGGMTVAEVNSVELNAASDILLGSAKFQTAIVKAETSGQTDRINVAGGFPFGVASTGPFGGIFIGSNTLTLRGQGVIASQNTAPASSKTQSGIVLTNDNKADVVLTLGTTSASEGLGAPKIIDLFGTLTDATGLVITGKDLAPSATIGLSNPLVIGASYRANGCVIGETGSCTVGMVLDTATIKLIQGVTITNPAIIPTYAVSILVAAQVATQTGDPTITGVGSEEIWRAPNCDRKAGEATCP